MKAHFEAHTKDNLSIFLRELADFDEALGRIVDGPHELISDEAAGIEDMAALVGEVESLILVREDELR